MEVGTFLNQLKPQVTRFRGRVETKVKKNRNFVKFEKQKANTCSENKFLSRLFLRQYRKGRKGPKVLFLQSLNVFTAPVI
jgi:hypothetical protein